MDAVTAVILYSAATCAALVGLAAAVAPVALYVLVPRLLICAGNVWAALRPARWHRWTVSLGIYSELPLAVMAVTTVVLSCGRFGGTPVEIALQALVFAHAAPIIPLLFALMAVANRVCAAAQSADAPLPAAAYQPVGPPCEA